LFISVESGEGSSKLNKQGIQMKDDHLHFEELDKDLTVELGRNIELLDREIVERRRIELELNESKRRYRLLADSITDAIWTFDWEGDIYVSSPVERLLRLS